MENPNQKPEDQKPSGIFSAPGGAAAPVAPASEPVVKPPAVEETDEEATPVPDEKTVREMLMTRARLMGIVFSNNIGTDTLRERVNAKMDGEPDPTVETDDDEIVEEEVVDEPAVVEAAQAAINPLSGELVNAPKKTQRQKIWDEQMKLVRVRITCMDPKKKDLHGEVLTVANEFLGTVRKFVPFGESTEEGFHLPFVLYTMLDERRFLNIRVRKDPRTKREIVESNYAKEFAIEVLPPLTKDELNRLAIAQAAAGSIDSLSA